MTDTNSNPKREVFARISIAWGNAVQLAGMAVAVALLIAAPRCSSRRLEIAAMVASWILMYFCCHAISHWAVGRLLGIRFVGYTVGGTGNPKGYPLGVRWVFAHLPFMGVQTDKTSMQEASSVAKAVMWSAGVTSSAIVPTLSTVWSWYAGFPGSKLFLIFAAIWAVGTLASNWTSHTGDYAKARRALRAG